MDIVIPAEEDEDDFEESAFSLSHSLTVDYLIAIAKGLPEPESRARFVKALMDGAKESGMAVSLLGMMSRNAASANPFSRVSFFGQICNEAGFEASEDGKKPEKHPVDDVAWQRLIEVLQKKQADWKEATARAHTLANIAAFTAEFNFSDDQAKSLRLFYAVSRYMGFNAVIGALGKDFGMMPVLSLCLYGKDDPDSVKKTRALVSEGSYFHKVGILASGSDMDSHIGRSLPARFGLLLLNSQLLELFDSIGVPDGGFARQILGEEKTTLLTNADFDYLPADETRLATALIRKGCGKSAGCFILLVGDVGAGKSEYARLLAANAGFTCYTAADSNSEDATNRHEQIAGLRFKYFVAQQKGKCALVIDDAEKLMANRFGGEEDRNYSDKAFLNELVERPGVPLIFTCNDLPFGRSVIRRTGLVIEFPETDAAIQARLWNSIAGKTQVTLDEKEITQIIATYGYMQPSLIETALLNASVLEDKAAIATTLRSLLKHLRGTARPQRVLPEPGFAYDPGILNVETHGHGPFEKLVAGLSAASPPASYLIYGKGGNGQDVLAREIVQRLGKKPLYIPSAMLGQKGVAAEDFFNKAHNDGKILYIDDVASERRESPLEQMALIQSLSFQVRRRDVPVILLTSPNVGVLYADAFDQLLGCQYPESRNIAALAKSFFAGGALPFVKEATLGDYFSVCRDFRVAASEAGSRRLPDAEIVRAQVSERVLQRRVLNAETRRFGF